MTRGFGFSESAFKGVCRGNTGLYEGIYLEAHGT